MEKINNNHGESSLGTTTIEKILIFNIKKFDFKLAVRIKINQKETNALRSQINTKPSTAFITSFIHNLLATSK